MWARRPFASVRGRRWPEGPDEGAGVKIRRGHRHERHGFKPHPHPVACRDNLLPPHAGEGELKPSPSGRLYPTPNAAKPQAPQAARKNQSNPARAALSLRAIMHAPKPHPAKVRPRHVAWAGLWLACLRALFAVGAVLSPRQSRRAAILWAPLPLLARLVTHLLLLASGAPLKWRMFKRYQGLPLKRASELRRRTRAAVRVLKLRRADGDQRAAIRRVLENLDAAIAVVRALFSAPFTRRRVLYPSIAAQAAAFFASPPLAYADSS